jgi:signal transduction histidine kinase
MSIEVERLRAEDIYRTILDGIDEVVLLLGEDYRIVWANKKAGDGLRGAHCYRVIHQREEPCKEIEQSCPLRESKETLAPAHTIHTHIGLDGKERYVEISVYPILRPSDKPLFVYLTKDITRRMEEEISKERMWIEIIKTMDKIYADLVKTQLELDDYRKTLEEKIMEKTKELEKTHEKFLRTERLAAIGELASGIAHELRNPLSSIKNALFFIKRKLNLKEGDPRIRDFIEIMEGAVDIQNKIITDLLTFSKGSSPAKRPSDLNNVVEDALRISHLPSTIEVIKELEGELPFVHIDPDQMRQVFVNLIMNAYQAMPDGGRLIIRAKKKNDMVCLTIKDTGCGIKEEDKERIFEPLFTTKSEGVGMGLAVSKAIVERNDCKIDFRSKEGEGSEFSVLIPIARG